MHFHSEDSQGKVNSSARVSPIALFNSALKLKLPESPLFAEPSSSTFPSPEERSSKWQDTSSSSATYDSASDPQELDCKSTCSWCLIPATEEPLSSTKEPNRSKPLSTSGSMMHPPAKFLGYSQISCGKPTTHPMNRKRGETKNEVMWTQGHHWMFGWFEKWKIWNFEKFKVEKLPFPKFLFWKGTRERLFLICLHQTNFSFCGNKVIIPSGVTTT